MKFSSISRTVANMLRSFIHHVQHLPTFLYSNFWAYFYLYMVFCRDKANAGSLLNLIKAWFNKCRMLANMLRSFVYPREFDPILRHARIWPDWTIYFAPCLCNLFSIKGALSRSFTVCCSIFCSKSFWRPCYKDILLSAIKIAVTWWEQQLKEFWYFQYNFFTFVLNKAFVFL